MKNQTELTKARAILGELNSLTNEYIVKSWKENTPEIRKIIRSLREANDRVALKVFELNGKQVPNPCSYEELVRAGGV